MNFFTVLFETVICIFAVYGIYALVCRLVAHFCYAGDLSIALHIKKDMSDDAVADMCRALVLTEAQKEKMAPPVILLDDETNTDTVPPGYAVYRKIH